MEEEEGAGSEGKTSDSGSGKITQQQNLVEDQKKLNRLVQDQRRSAGRIRIPGQLDRWTRVKEEHGLSSHEDVARLLLDTFDKVQEKTEENCIRVSNDIMVAFHDFEVKVKLNADEILKFFLSLGVLPGNKTIAVDNDVKKTFDILKANLALNSTQLMNYLFGLHEGSGMKTEAPAQSDPQPLSQTVRQAVREEIHSLIQDGLIPTRQSEYQSTLTKDGLVMIKEQATLTKDNQSLVTMVNVGSEVASKENGLATMTEDGYLIQTQDGDQGLDTSEEGVNVHSASSGEFGGKKRSRKSHPQRVVTEAEDTVMDIGADNMEEDEPDLQLVNTTINGDNLKPQLINKPNGTRSANSTPVSNASQYEYVLNVNQKNDTKNMSSLQTLDDSTDMADDSICYDSPEDTNSNTATFVCPFCNYRTPIIAHLKRHMTIHTGKAYKCTKCEKSYVEEYKLREHFKIKHLKSVHFVCEHCRRDFTSKGGLKYHMKTMHRKEFVHWCDACCKGFKDPHTYETHIEIKHNRPQSHTCSSCFNTFKSAANLSMHKKACNRLHGINTNETDKKETNFFNRFPCEICPQRFSTFHDLKDHSNSVHSDISPYRCSCGLEFKLRASYNGHRHNCRVAISIENEAKATGKSSSDGSKGVDVMNVESLKGKFEAKSLDFGNRKSSPSSKTEIQITNLESGEQFMLADKAKASSAQSEQEKQLDSDDDEKLFIDLMTQSPDSPIMHCCEYCDYKTPKLSHIKRHKLIHTGKKYKCDKCPKSFNEKGKLKTHMNSKHKGHARYKCEVCFRTFSSKGGIVYHQQTKHNNTHKYRCEVCDKGFNQLQHYLGHKNTHSGIRPHVCDICNQGFSYPSVLVAHRKICKGKKEESAMEEMKFHPCSECGEKFILQDNLEEHIRKEHGQDSEDVSSVLCDCGVVFTGDALLKHKPTCTGATVSQMFVKASADNDVSMETGDENTDFKQMSPEKFSLIVSQPVFPT